MKFGIRRRAPNVSNEELLNIMRDMEKLYGRGSLVNEIAARAGLSASAVSNKLRAARSAGLVERYRVSDAYRGNHEWRVVRESGDILAQ